MTASRALARVQRQWTELGERDPLWAVLTRPGKKAGGWDVEAFFATGAQEIEETIRSARALAPLRFEDAVDFGCGVGRLSQALAQRFERVIGVDVAESMIRAAARLNRYGAKCRYIHNTAADLSQFPDASADLIYSNITLQHVVPALARAYIAEFFRVARPGAHVIFQVPSRPRSHMRYWLKRAVPVELANLVWRLRTGSPEAMESYFVPEAEIRALVTGCGGSVVSIEFNQEGPPGWESPKYFCLKTTWS